MCVSARRVEQLSMPRGATVVSAEMPWRSWCALQMPLMRLERPANRRAAPGAFYQFTVGQLSVKSTCVSPNLPRSTLVWLVRISTYRGVPFIFPWNNWCVCHFAVVTAVSASPWGNCCISQCCVPINSPWSSWCVCPI